MNVTQRNIIDFVLTFMSTLQKLKETYVASIVINLKWKMCNKILLVLSLISGYLQQKQTTKKESENLKWEKSGGKKMGAYI